MARDKDVMLKLLNIYGFKYEVISGYYYTMLGKMHNFIQTVRKLLKKARKMRPDMLIGVGDLYVAHVGRLIGKPSIVFTDTEDAKLANVLTFPFASVICTPSCFKEDLGGSMSDTTAIMNLHICILIISNLMRMCLIISHLRMIR